MKVTVAPWQWDAQTDRLRIIAPITDTPEPTPERAEAYRAVAAQRHLIQIDNRVDHGACLHRAMQGEKVEALLPLRKDLGHAWMNVPGRTPERIELAPTFACGDRAGARYQAGLEAASNRAVRDLARDVDPTVSTFKQQKRAADMTPPKPPAPELRTGPRVIDKTALRKSDRRLADDAVAETQRTMLAMIEKVDAFNARAASGSNR